MLVAPWDRRWKVMEETTGDPDLLHALTRTDRSRAGIKISGKPPDFSPGGSLQMKGRFSLYS